MILCGFSFSLLFCGFDGFDFLVHRKLQVRTIYIFSLFIYYYFFYKKIGFLFLLLLQLL